MGLDMIYWGGKLIILLQSTRMPCSLQAVTTNRNCNNFSNELAYRLTGKRIPHWINRAAWVATSVPCLIPEGWIDNEEEVDLEVAGVTIAPPRADKVMEIPTERAGRS